MSFRNYRLKLQDAYIYTRTRKPINSEYRYSMILSYLLHIGVLDAMSQTHTLGSSSPPAEATKRSLGDIPTAATDARCKRC